MRGDEIVNPGPVSIQPPSPVIAPQQWTAALPPPPVQSPPPQQQPVLRPPPAHAKQEDPHVLAVEMVRAAVKDAKRSLLAEAAHDLPGALDRLAAKRYVLMTMLAALLFIGVGLGLGWYIFRYSMACETTSHPGWRTCHQWIG